MKLLRTIRLDPSDTFVFEHAAEPGEWAVSGAFMFWDGDPAAMEGKERAAFRSGFLGVHDCVRVVAVSAGNQLCEFDEFAGSAVRAGNVHFMHLI